MQQDCSCYWRKKNKIMWKNAKADKSIKKDRIFLDEERNYESRGEI